MCDCFHLAFPNWHAASSGTGAGRRLRAPEPGTEDDSTCDEPSQFTERPRPQGSSPVEEYPETEKYTDSDKECEEEHDPHYKSGSGRKTKKSGLGSMFEKRSTPKMSKLKEVHSPESGLIVKTAKDGCAEGLVYGGGGREGIFIKEVVPESPASKSLKLKEGDQILSATVYFDNVSYEDAIQILEHAQAYKVKLCLKRKPNITETEPTIESDVIPEEDVYAPEMREQGKTKRRGDARISWPKFPSFGKGQKSRFTRSHSSSEADEQRKLELSPTTSDTESPIKSQDALKGKKKHKVKLSALTKRGRISSSEDQDTDAPTTTQMISPECLESPSGETPQIYAEDLRREQADQKLTEPQTVQHKVELIDIDSTVKTADLTAALAGQESLSGIKSPDGKKKKKERSELKLKILGKDKSHKKDAKAKSSPKRLKTLGASIEIADQPGNEKSDDIPNLDSQTRPQGDQLALDGSTQIISSDSSRIIPTKSGTTQMETSAPKVELEISDVLLIQKSPQKGKDKDMKQKQETKIGPTFKLPKIGFCDLDTEEIIPKNNVNVEEGTTEIEQVTADGTEVKEDPYERLSKSSRSRTKLPKREDIEIPGMEDKFTKPTAKRIKEPKAGYTGNYEDIQAETVQLSIDVDSVKEAVSKLPGFKLPKVDTSGVPIPEEITVIDANAQRISVKTPTKTKHETHFSKFDVAASPEISKTSVNLPKITPTDLSSEELLIETRVDFNKPEKKYKTEPKQGDGEVYKREHIVIPGKESACEVAILQTQGTEGIKSEYESAATFKSKKMTMPRFGIAKPDIRIPDIGTDLPKQTISEQKVDNVKGERTIFFQEVKVSKTETGNKMGRVISDVRIPEIEGIEYIDSVDGLPAKKDAGIKLTGLGDNLHAAGPKSDLSFPEIRDEIKDAEAEEHKFKLPKFEAVTPNISGTVPDAGKDMTNDGTETEKDGRFKIPTLSMPKVIGPKIDLSLSRKDVDISLLEAKAETELTDIPEVDVSLGKINLSLPEQKMEIEKPELEIKPWQTEGELDGHGRKFKIPKLGIKMPKLKGPEFDLSLSKKDVDVTLPEAKPEIKLPEAPKTDVTLGNVGVSIPEQKMEIEKPELEIQPLRTEGELDGQGGKFKIPKFVVKIPKVKEPEFDFSSSKKDVNVTLPEAKAEIKLPETPKIDASLGKAEVLIPEAKVEVRKPEVKVQTLQTNVELEGHGGKFQVPKFGISMPKVKGPEIHFGLSKKDGDVTPLEATAEVKSPEAPEVDVSLGKADVSLPMGKIEVKKPELEIKPLQSEVELDGQGSKFKMSKLGVSMPKVKGPEIHFGLSKKDGDGTLPEAKAEVDVPGVELKEPSAKVKVKAPEIHVATKGIEGSPTKFKMPTFKLPKFGIVTPNISAEPPDTDKSVKIDGADINIPDEGSAVHITAPSIDIDGASIEMKTEGTEQDGKGSKFKMPHLGLSMPKVKGPKIDLSLSRKDADVTLPEAKTDVQLPDVNLGKVDVSIPEAKAEIKLPEDHKLAVEMKPPEAEMDGHGEKFKMPKFGIKMPKIKGPEFDLNLSKKDGDVTLPEAKADAKFPKVDLGKVDVSVPEATVEVKKPDMEKQFLQTEGELDGQGGKFKMPKLGIKMPKLKGPEFDLSLSKKDVDVTLPEAKAEVKLPEAPKTDINLGNADVSIPEVKANVEKPELEIKPLQTEVEVEGSKFKMPKFGMSMPKVKGPEFHLGFSKKDGDVTLPEAKADVNLPDVELKDAHAKVEIKAPEIENVARGTEGSPSKFKMPNFSFSMPKVKGPDIDLSLSKKDTDVILPGTKAEIKLPEAPKIDANLGQAEVLIPEAKVKVRKPDNVGLEGHGGKLQVRKFGITMPKVKGPEIDLSFSKKDVDVTIPEAKAEVELPDAPDIGVDMKPPGCEVEIDGQGSKFKMPKFGITVPKVKGPETDLGFSKKDVDVTLPEAKAEVKLPDVELKEPSAKVEIRAPEIEAQLGHVEGSPSKFKLPSFKFPKFGAATPNISAEVPEMDKDIKVEGAKFKIPKDGETVDIAAQNVDIDGPSLDVKMKGTEGEGKESKFKVPKFGISLPKVQGPEIDLSLPKKDIKLPEAKPEVELPEGSAIDVNLGTVDVSMPEAKMEVKHPELEIKAFQSEGELDGQGHKLKIPKFGISVPTVKGTDIDFSLSKKDADITLPEAKAEVSLPDVELEEPSAKVEIKAPEMEAQLGNVKGSPSKFKLPTFKFPKFGSATANVSAEVPDIDRKLKIDGTDMHIPVPQTDEVKAEVHLPEVEVTKPSGSVVIDQQLGAEVDAKLKKSRFSLPRFSFSKPSVNVPEMDDSLQDVKVAIPESKVEVKKGEVDMNIPELEAEVDGSKFRMPKFGISLPKVKGPEIDLSLSKTDVDVTLPEAKAEVQLPDVELKDPEVEIKAPEIKVSAKGKEGSPSKFKLPTFKLPKFGVSTPSATVDVPDKDIKIEGADINIPEEVLTVDIAAPSVDIEGPSIDIKTTGIEHEGKGGKFKLPSLGFSGPQIKGPEIDLSLSKKDVDVTLPEAKAEVKLPEDEIKQPEVEIKSPEIKVSAKGKEGSPSKFKMPSFTFPKFGAPKVSVEVPDVDTDVQVDGATVDVTAPSIDTEGVSVDVKAKGSDVEGSGSKFKMPKFGISMPKVKGPEMDLSLSKKDVDVTLPEAKAEVRLPDVEVKQPEVELKLSEGDVELEGQERKFKMPKFGISLPKVKGPEMDLSLSKKDVDVTLPEAKAEVKLPDVKMKQPSATVEIKSPETEGQTGDVDGSPAKLKMPSFTFPKFGAPKVSVEVPDVDTDVQVDGATVDVTAPSIDTEGVSVDVKAKGSDVEGSGSTFKMPKFGISLPKVKGPEMDLSLSKKDVDVTLPEAKAEVKLPEAEVKQPEVEIKAPEIKVSAKGKEGSPSKFKMPIFKLPKFGAPKVSVEVPDVDTDVQVDGATVDVTAPSIDTEGVSVDVKAKGSDVEGSGSKFKMPKFGISMPKVKGPEMDLSLSKKDADVTLPEAKAEVRLPDVEVKQPEVELKLPEGDVELEGQESKFKMPKFGISMPKVKGPEMDLSLSKKDVDVTLPEAKTEVQLPDVEVKDPEVEIKSPEIKVSAKGKEGSPSKFKMPSFTFPKFGAPKVSVEVPDVDTDVQVDGATVDVTAPSIDTEGVSVDVKAKGSDVEGSGSKFKMPKFGISMPKVKGPEMDLSLSKKDADVTLPEAKAEVRLPDVEVKQPEVELKLSEGDVELEGQERKFKMPKFGISLPKVKGPEMDLSLSKKDVDVTLPEAKTEVKLPDVKMKQPSATVEIKSPETEGQTGDVDGSPAKLKMPSFTFPKFGAPKVSVEVPDVDTDVQVDGATVDVTAPSIDTEGVSVDVKAKGSDVEGSGSKFKMPKFGISMPKVKGPEMDLSLSKKDVDVTLPEAKAEVRLPDVEVKDPEVEIKAPEIKVSAKGKEGSPSKFKLPTFKLPKFGVSTPSATVDVPDKNVKFEGADINIPEEVLTVDIAAPSVDIEGPSIDIKTTGTEHEGKGGKFKLPSLGFSGPQIKGPEIDLSSSKKNVDVTLPEAKAEVKLPEVEIKSPEIKVSAKGKEGSPSKFKMPSFTFPKFGAPNVSVEVPDVDTDVQVDGATVDVTAPSIDTEGVSVDVKAKGSDIEGLGSTFKMPKFGISMPKVKGPEMDLSLSKKDADVTLPEAKAEVRLPDVEVKQPEVELKLSEGDVELEGQERKFKMPKFGISLPKVKGPEMDLSLSKKGVDVTLPEAKTEVKLPDVKMKQPSATVEIKSPETEGQTGDVDGSPAKLKMPSFTFPKFGAPKVSVEVPDVDTDVQVDGATVDVTAPSIDTEGVSVDVKAKGSDVEGSGSKFKMPKFGISMPKVKGPEMDLSLSKKDADVTLPEAKAEVRLPEVEVKQPEGAISVPDAPTTEVEAKLKRPNWTFPKFSFSRTGSKAPDVDVNFESPKVDVTSPGAKAEVHGPSGSISVEEPHSAELDANLKKTTFSLPGFSLSKSNVKEGAVSAQVDVSLPEGEVIVKQPEMKMKAPEFEAEHDEQGSKFKLPKFGIALPKTKGPEEELSASQRDVGITLPDVKAEVKLPEVKQSSASVEIKASESEAKSKDVGGSPSKFKMPTVKMPKFGGAVYDVTVEAPAADKATETKGAKLKEDVTVTIKGPSVDIKTDVSKAAAADSEAPKTETDSAGLASPSKFKLPTFKMPKLSFSRAAPEAEHVPVDEHVPEDEHVPVDTDSKDQLKKEAESKAETKSPKQALTSFGEILKNIDVEFDVPKPEESLETSKDVHDTDEPSGKKSETKKEETKQDTVKSPERTGWFKFPRFGLSSPSEPAKTPEKDEHKDKKSPAGESVDEEISQTCSVQSSDAFADISSAMTSEHAGLSLSSPTKVTVKYSDPDAATVLGEMHSNIITSTTRTELVSVEPNLPEKITILSSGVSSSSEDTLRLESGKIHVITSNIQATPEAQHAKLLTALQVQSAGALPLQSDADEAAAWTVEDSHGGKRTVLERRLVRETSSGRSESKETIVITKQITRSLEPISGETASSVQRLRDSVHLEKMRFFDGVNK
ncbi:neuroblast differentiation-associated protein AHNAK-like isoform X2 [Epinephelus fuscoguttatus]|uniref:neuroblast differentiation-associated protein AHNAK-like isoform X2 n=1 Tax=Epinephelus fuscoguttatus TaxID=293821 RepID=UPI0020D01CC2|nr:neuroblast differentiation-associated protein AHNAK-like isoform X2 [Epinephelus fuscoguttatus]